MKKILILITLILTSCSKDYHQTIVTPPATNNNPSIPVTINNAPSIDLCGSKTFQSDSYTLGSIGDQNGWFVQLGAGFNESILDIGTSACRGTGVWMINNTFASGGFGNQPLSPNFTISAGESTVRTPDGGDTFEYSFFIKTVNTSDDGSAFVASISPESADRHTWLRFLNNPDASGGFQIVADDPVQGFVNLPILTNLSRNIWYHIKVISYNPDGAYNDVVLTYINNRLVNVQNSWEDWRRSQPTNTIDLHRVLFRMSAASANAQGFYIDDFEQKVYNYNKPDTLIQLYQTGFEQ